MRLRIQRYREVSEIDTGSIHSFTQLCVVGIEAYVLIKVSHNQSVPHIRYILCTYLISDIRYILCTYLIGSTVFIVSFTIAVCIFLLSPEHTAS